MALQKASGVHMQYKPNSFKVGASPYKVHYVNEDRGREYGAIYYGTKAIVIYTKNRAEESVSETFWHEMTHAVLHEMQHKLYNDEKFVTQFAKLLNEAINSARE
jgi:predicted SprT family Zn-dependent metalloprotease